MAKLTLNDISGILNNPTGAATAINNNSALIETALENTLSRDGTSPNEMEANLDMNDNRILNLPEAGSSAEPVTLGQARNILTANGLVEDSDFITQGNDNLFLTVDERAKLADLMTSVMDHGAIGDGATDDTDAIQNAIDYVAGLGGGVVYVPPGDYRISSTLFIEDSAIRLEGMGGGTPHDVASQNGISRINWYGSAGGTMLKIHTPFGTASTRVHENMKASGIQLNCRAIAAYGLQIVSVRSSVFEDIYVLDPTTAAFQTDCGVTGTNFGEAADVRNCLFKNLTWRATDTVAVRSAHGVHMNGSSNANTSFNTWVNCTGQTYNGNGWEMEGCDSNVLIGCANFSVGTGKDFNLHGITTTTNPVGGDNNTFIHCSWSSSSGKFQIGGTDVYDGAVTNNIIIAWDEANSSAMPTLGTGANFISPVRGELLTIKGVGTNTSRIVRDIAASAADQVLRVNSGNSAIGFGAIDLTKTAAASKIFTDFTPTLTSAGGTLGTYTISKARWSRAGSEITGYFHITITSAGSSPTGALIFTLPIDCASNAAGEVSGYDLNTGNIVGGYITGASQRMLVTFNSGLTATGNGTSIIAKFWYEAA